MFDAAAGVRAIESNVRLSGGGAHFIDLRLRALARFDLRSSDWHHHFLRSMTSLPRWL